MTVHEQLARSAKVLKLCMSIDAGLGLLEIDPFSLSAMHAVEGMTDAAWKCAASHANVPMPSATTRTQVEDVYRRRIEIRACLNRIPMCSVAR